MIIVFCIFISSFVALLGFYLLVFSRLAFLKWSSPCLRSELAHPPSQTPQMLSARGTSEPAHQHITQSPNPPITESSNQQQPVSVIICAKNELENLKKFLPVILEQDYPAFEVIVVNDNSTDNSQQWLEEYAKNDSRLRVIENTSPEKNLPGKRSALKKGMEAAKYELLLLTDADCQPASNRWIRLMASAVRQDTEIVLGFSPCFEQSGITNRFVRYENFLTALYYLSFALVKMPYMGVGRNLLYRTSVTGTIKALEHHSGLISGDDDLTVNRIAANPNTALMLNPMSHVFTVAPQTFRAFIQQKRRHYTTGFYYKPQHRLILGTLYSSQILFNITAIALFVSGCMLLPLLLIFITKNILQTIVFGKAMRKLNVHNLWIFTPVFDLCMSMFFLTLGGLSLFKTKTWK